MCSSRPGRPTANRPHIDADAQLVRGTTRLVLGTLSLVREYD